MIICIKNFHLFYKTLSLLIIILVLSTLSFGQTIKNDSLKSYLLEPVVVTGTRYRLPKSEISSSITVIGNKEIRGKP